MGDYEFHMSTIREWVFDSFKTVTFKYLAHNLSVSSNYAKQMLFDFAERNKGKVNLTYYISGMSKSDQSFRITIVQESHLVEFEKKLESLVSKHLYSVSASALTDSAQLWAADREIYHTSDPNSTENWNLIHDTSAVACSAVDKRPKVIKKTTSTITPAPITSRSTSLQAVQSTPPLQKQTSAPVPQLETKQTDSAPAKTNIKTPGANAKKSIMGMFAASANKPKATAAASTAQKTEEKVDVSADAAAAPTELNGSSEQVSQASNSAMDITEATPAKKTESKTPSKTTAKATAKSAGQRTISFAKMDPSALPIAEKKVESQEPADKAAEKDEIDEDSSTAAPAAEPTPAPKKSPVKKSPVKSPKKSPGKAGAAKKTSAMDVDSSPTKSPAKKTAKSAASSSPKSLEDELMEDFDAESEESSGLSKLKKNNVPDDDDAAMDTEDDPYGEGSKEAKAARAKKKEEEKQKSRKEAAEARKKARDEAKAAEKAAEEAENPTGDDKKKRRRKRSLGSEDGEEAEAPVVITEQRRRFDAYFGATPSTAADSSEPNGSDEPEVMIYTSTVEVPKTRTRKIVEEEEYVNEKGYTVTRTIERTVEEDIPEEERAKLKTDAEEAHKRRIEEDEARKRAEAKKAAAVASAKASPAKAAAPAAKKASIMSFWKKA